MACAGRAVPARAAQALLATIEAIEALAGRAGDPRDSRAKLCRGSSTNRSSWRKHDATSDGDGGGAGGGVHAWAAPAMAAGTLKVAVSSNLNTLDPAKTKIGEEYIVNFLVFSGLTEIDRTGKTSSPTSPSAGRSSDDLKTWTFYLRKGVKFHHGREFDAQDVIATVQRIQDKATGSVTRVNFEVIDKMEALDANTVRFTLKAPYAGLADIFSDRQARIVPRDKLDTLAREPIGTGPFKFKSFKPGDRVELEKNPDYYVPGVP